MLAAIRHLRLIVFVLLLAGLLTALAAEKTPAHWAFVPPERPSLPEVSNRSWAISPIDRFVLARLEQAGIAPSPEADRQTLIRRLHLDLIGLPPSGDSVRAFVRDRSPDAVERLVERLLASPHFGERWGRHWLDLARYADSDGYLGDTLRPYAWVYRDWAINAINDDLPFDQFTRQQIAGDLLPQSTIGEKIAAGFHRNTLKNTEAGADRELNRTKEVVDRVNTTGTVWLGLTVGCAECHDHKHDPISQVEYYRLFAFFNNTDEITISAPQPLEQARYQVALAAWEREYIRLEQQFADFEKRELSERARKWADALQPSSNDWDVVKPHKAESGGGNTMEIQPDGSIIAGGKNGATATYTIQVTNSPATRVSAIRLEVFGALGEGKKTGAPSGRGQGGQFILSSLAFATERSGEKGTGQPLKSVEVTGGETAKDALNTSSTEGWAVTNQTYRYQSAVFQLRQPVEVAAGSRLVFAMRQKHGTENTLRHFRISLTGATNAQPTSVPDDIAGLIGDRAAKRTEKDSQRVVSFYRNIDPDWIALRRPIESHLAKVPTAPSTKAQTLVERTKARRESFVHVRGDYARPGKHVGPGTPGVLHAFAAKSKEPTRLDLARWLTAPANPLTDRVTVNRIWQRLFGVGLVASSDDFGTKGAPPSHPLLLDWLACELQSTGWSRKAIIRKIVLSATYRQSSAMRPKLVGFPSGNKLLWRQNSFRLDAEAIRDSHLVASGVFESRIGGPGIRPLLPSFVTDVGRSVKWSVSEGGERYRRGMYIFFKRTVPYPMLITFDAPDSSVSCSRRERSNSPLQALTLLNDPVFFECAEALGRAFSVKPGADARESIRRMFERCLGRAPLPEELDSLGRAFEDFAAGKQGAGKAVEPIVAIARIIMNLDEFITRD